MCRCWAVVGSAPSYCARYRDTLIYGYDAEHTTAVRHMGDLNDTPDLNEPANERVARLFIAQRKAFVAASYPSAENRLSKLNALRPEGQSLID